MLQATGLSLGRERRKRLGPQGWEGQREGSSITQTLQIETHHPLLFAIPPHPETRTGCCELVGEGAKDGTERALWEGGGVLWP